MARTLGEREVQALENLARQIEERGLPAEGERLRLILELADHSREVAAPIAARVLRASENAVTHWVRRGMLPGRIAENGQALVNVDVLWRAIDLDTAMPYADPATPDVSEGEILAEIAAYRAEQKAE